MSDPGATIITKSRITCPACGHVEEEIMPTNACVWYYECPACHELLKPEKGDCCVFCSFGSVPCPPVQENRSSGGSGCCAGNSVR